AHVAGLVHGLERQVGGTRGQGHVLRDRRAAVYGAAEADVPPPAVNLDPVGGGLSAEAVVAGRGEGEPVPVVAERLEGHALRRGGSRAVAVVVARVLRVVAEGRPLRLARGQ